MYFGTDIRLIYAVECKLSEVFYLGLKKITSFLFNHSAILFAASLSTFISSPIHLTEDS